MKRKKRLSLTNEMFLHSLRMHLFYMLIPLLIFSALTLFITIRDQSDRVQSTMDATATMLGDYADNLYAQSDLLMLSFFQTNVYSEVLSLLKASKISYDNMITLKMVAPWLYATANANELIDSIYIYTQNQNGYFLSSSIQSIALLSAYYDTGWHQECLQYGKEREAWISHRFYAQYADMDVPDTAQISVFRSISNGRLCIIMNVSADTLTKRLRETCVYEGQEILLVDPEGRSLISTAGTQTFPLQNYVNAENAGTTIHAREKDDYHIIMPVWSNQLYMVVSLPNAVVYRHARIQLMSILLMLLTCVILCVILSSRYARREQKKLMALYRLVETNEACRVQAEEVKAYDIYSYIEQNMVSAYIRQSRLELELQKNNYAMKSMELTALQAQINPHFLINTISTITWMTLSLTDGAPSAPSLMLEDLCELMGLLTSDPNEMIPWALELRCLHSYLSIQKRRYGDRFTYTERVEEACLQMPIAKLLLQPVVENCFVHAMPDQGVLNISVDIRIEDSTQRICVQNDGLPFSDTELRTLRAHFNDETAYRHIGLYNVVKRLSLLYGVKDPLAIQSGADGTAVRIAIPLKPLSTDGWE